MNTTSHTLSDDLACDFEAFAKVVRTRRSVRAYLSEPIPDEVLDKCLDLALLAPNSQNLEPWQFIEVRDPVKLAQLRRLCLSQAQAIQAPLDRGRGAPGLLAHGPETGAASARQRCACAQHRAVLRGLTL